ncbi:MAG: hypothetical protein A2289_09540 [Deltaproteobacteria bacterium RIFOXYA12_FULL_58_15]|nr:MAG: hypothetical protein A2289_09540 [Deltaproteobacteria bacterium RIFOXYA12_FULL_58_15]OGR12509.1 MAG: hypothetical protein A2341_13845 [Deltaproteobacteria bacterium RIFOXYB12_FULL_58_9]
MSTDNRGAARLGEPLHRSRREKTIATERHRALAVFKALASSGRDPSRALLSFSGRRANVEAEGMVTVCLSDCHELADRLRDVGYPLTDEGIRLFKMERGFSDVVRIGPDVAEAYARFANGMETRVNVTAQQWERLDVETQTGVRILMVVGRSPERLIAVREALGVRGSKKVPDGMVLVGSVTAERLVQWAHGNGWTFDRGGLEKIAEARGVDSPDINESMAQFVSDAVLCRDEPDHNYTRHTHEGRTINRRTVTMVKSAEASLPEGMTFGVIKGSYIEVGTRGAHPHVGGGVVDLSISTPWTQEAIRRAVGELRRAGFAAWFRDRSEVPHLHAVAIGDREMSAAAWWQVKAFFAGRDGRTRLAQDPHADIGAESPEWSIRYRIPAL